MRYLFILSLLFISCSEDGLNSTLTIVNDRVDESITRVSLVGYDFDNINIRYGKEKTFNLKDGINGGYDDVNVTFETEGYGDAYRISKSFIFWEDNNTRITLIDCPDDPSCDCTRFLLE